MKIHSSSKVYLQQEQDAKEYTMKTLKLLIILLISLATVSSMVNARKGVGILWSTETVVVNENEERCVEYGLYNPWDEDITVNLETSKEINEILKTKDVDTVNIVAFTTHENSIPAKLCFDVPEVYEKDCLIGNVLCEKRCDQEPIVYGGEIIVSEKPTATQNGGSSTSSSASSRLNVKVNCTPEARNLIPLYLVIIVILVIVIASMLYQKRKIQKGNPI